MSDTAVLLTALTSQAYFPRLDADETSLLCAFRSSQHSVAADNINILLMLHGWTAALLLPRLQGLLTL